ncbi:hypothetical protein SDC9_210206 [bioreactor metagenome]|uniref:Uncharacterized protein n=1 Tax=bioreactor metagenome TaxID=1076179 RepID=A0A645JGH5_9ZZZZ
MSVRNATPQAFIASGLGHLEGDEPANLAQLLNSGIQAAIRHALFGGKLRQCFSSSQKHRVSNTVCLTDQHAQSHARENEHVVALANDMQLAIVLYRFKWGSGRHQRPALRVC